MYYIIYQTAFIGDIILSTSMIKTILQADPEGKIIFITTPAGEEILHNDERINKIIVYDKHVRDKGFNALLQKVNEIKSITSGEDSVFISPHRFVRASLFGYLSGAKTRAGFKGSSFPFLYNLRVNYRFGIHEINRNFELLSAVFGDRLINFCADKPELYPSKNDSTRVKNYLHSFFLQSEKIIAIAPGSVWATKRWPYENYLELIKLLQNKDFRIALIGGKEDSSLCASLSLDGVLNLSGELTILQSAAAIGLCNTLITNDSAPLHFASAMNVPTVAIFGATTQFLGFGPLAEKSIVVENTGLECRPCGRHGGRKCNKKHFACMKSITPQMVLDAVIKIAK
jgi:heptosyltransferase II